MEEIEVPKLLDGKPLMRPPFHGRWARLDSHGDGSCFFHSVASALNWRGYRDLSLTQRVRTGRELRKLVVTRENWDRYAAAIGLADFGNETGLDAFEEACNFKRPADNVTWALTAHCLKIRILVLVRPGEIYDSGDQLSPVGAPTVLIAWIGRNHFEPIVRLGLSDYPPSEEAVAQTIEALGDDKDDGCSAVLEPSARGYVGTTSWRDPVIAALFGLKRRDE